MKKLFLALIALVAMTANAQNGVSTPTVSVRARTAHAVSRASAS